MVGVVLITLFVVVSFLIETFPRLDAAVSVRTRERLSRADKGIRCKGRKYFISCRGECHVGILIKSRLRD